MQFSTHLSQ